MFFPQKKRKKKYLTRAKKGFLSKHYCLGILIESKIVILIVIVVPEQRGRPGSS